MSDTPTPRAVRFTAYALFLLLFLVILVLAAELYARSQKAYGRTGFVFSEDLIYQLSPGYTATNGYASGKVGKPPFTLRINKQGFRGDDFQTKPAGKTRILVIGDSYTAGLDYPDSVTFVGQWEKLLNADGERFEVINASCPAWGVDQHYLFWEKYGQELQPDHVVIMMSPNDIREGWNHRIVYYDEESSSIQKNSPTERIPEEERLGWERASKYSLYQMLQKERWGTDYGNFLRVFWYFPVHYGIEDSTDWDRPLFLKRPFAEMDSTYLLAEKLYQSIRKDCETMEATFHLVKIPIRLELAVDTTYQDSMVYDRQMVERQMAELATRSQIPFINLNQSLRDHPNPNDIFMDWEYHYDEDGHDWVARALYDKLGF